MTENFLLNGGTSQYSTTFDTVICDPVTFSIGCNSLRSGKEIVS